MSQKQRILIIEDDASIRFGLEEILGKEDYETAVCETGGPMVEEKVAAFSPHLIVLDVMLPERNGYDICKALREDAITTPVLMLTAKGQELDKVVGLDCGADDYVTKPFGVQELVARISALLRRAELPSSADESASGSFTVGKSEVKPETFEISNSEGTQPLTPKELDLLQCLHRNRGKALSRDQLLNEVWGINYFGTTRTLDQTIAQLRKKIGDAGKPRYLLTVHGVGYKLLLD